MTAGWVGHIAPQLADERRVVAIDLSGHGDSYWRGQYDIDTWAREVLAAAAGGAVRADTDEADRPQHGRYALGQVSVFGVV